MNPTTLDKRIVRSRSAFKDAILSLLKVKKFDSITITDIVRTANYNRGTFYAHYYDKEALMEELIADLMQGFITAFRAPYKDVDVFAVQEMPIQSISVFDHFYSQKESYRILFQSDYREQLKSNMMQTLLQLTSNELVYTGHKLDHKLLQIYSTSALAGLLFHWIENDFKHTPEYMQQQLYQLIRIHPATVQAKHYKQGSVSS
ncbi:TetR/AcrR family transcriptional regulator [Paenibacillus yanchengensis]|uniref:TetR/AcrR family transcriptional regulator n=1 Tax=Paenibacillus yanchengensis TaxID=2035833 RepID=A0ABW4YGG8_9BACL